MSNQSDDRKRQVLNNVSLELHQHAGASPRRELTHEKISNHNQAVVAWELQVKKGVTLPAFSRNLFTQWLQQPDVDLLQLQNRCASPLLFGRMNADWVPENSFSWSQVQPVQDQLQAADVYPSWQIAGQQRPLFIEKKPRPFTIKPTRQQLTFLERVATDWGGDSDEGEFKPVNNHENDHENELENELESERHCYRDYFKYHSSQGQQLWLFRDQDGKWFVHGMFN